MCNKFVSASEDWPEVHIIFFRLSLDGVALRQRCGWDVDEWHCAFGLYFFVFSKIPLAQDLHMMPQFSECDFCFSSYIQVGAYAPFNYRVTASMRVMWAIYE